jgi:hypothetical protein
VIMPHTAGCRTTAKKPFALIVQLGRHKPALKKPLSTTDMPACTAPIWQRDPVRVTFDPKGEQKFSFIVRSRAVDLIEEDEDAGTE